MSAAFEFVEGATSDLAFVARGPSLEALFAAAGDALLAATVEDPSLLATRDERAVDLEEPDVELLLLRFLNELVWLRDAKGLLLRVSGIHVEAGPPARLSATLVGEPLSPHRHALATDVKGATAHGLRIEEGPEGFVAHVTLDV
ncbi:MAG TPA: archease [Myxococcota bacterium]|jgi:SHS2 domain-containing protein|nr:archease [Myxococcota bacterium]